MAEETLVRPIDRLKQTFSGDLRPQMAYLVKQGVAEVQRLIPKHSMFQSNIGHHSLSQVRRAGIADSFMEAVNTGKLPFTYQENPNEFGFYYLELNYEGFTFHIVKVPSAGMLPLKVDYRLRAYQTNQPSLFEKLPNQDGPLFALLTYVFDKKQGVTHVQMGLPDKTGESWLSDELVDLTEYLVDYENKHSAPETKTAPASEKIKLKTSAKNQKERKKA
jgi:hypothetical protein